MNEQNAKADLLEMMDLIVKTHLIPKVIKRFKLCFHGEWVHAHIVRDDIYWQLWLPFIMIQWCRIPIKGVTIPWED